jgi:hypothetical protein
MKQFLTLALLAIVFVSCSKTERQRVRTAKLSKTGYTIAIHGIPEELMGTLQRKEEVIVSYSSNTMKWNFDEVPTIKFAGTDTLLVGDEWSFSYYKAILN